MNLVKMLKHAEKFTIDNSPAILTAIGITGTVATAYLSGKAAIKANQILQETAELHALELNDRFRLQEQLRLTWKEFVPPVVTGLITVSAIFGANRIGSKRAAAMATAYSLSERAFMEYKDKVVEKVGAKKEQEVRDEVAQDRVDRNPVENNTVIITDGGEVLCYDQYTGRYFKSSMESLKRAENAVNYTINHRDYASLSDFYDEIGLPSTGVSDEVGWTTDQLLEIQFSTVLSEDGRPCIAIDFNHRPIRGFDQYGSC
jgi:hypothetical protein